MKRFQGSLSRIGLAVGVSLVFSVLVDVCLRKGIADPAGSTIERSLPTLGFSNVRDVNVGKTIRFVIEAEDEKEAHEKVESICSTFLTNPVIEEATITVENMDQVEGN
jgi:phosphoribosylformylglycinamidine synthase subunit PurS